MKPNSCPICCPTPSPPPLCQKWSSINDGLPLPYPAINFFSNPPLHRIDPTRVVGTPLKLDVLDSNGKVRTIITVFFKDNLMLGVLCTYK